MFRMQEAMLRICTVTRSDDFWSVQNTCSPHLIADDRYAGLSIEPQQYQQLLTIVCLGGFSVSCNTVEI